MRTPSGTPPSIKRAISLPIQLDESLRRLARRDKKSYSGLIREAVEQYLKIERGSRMEEAYARYYASPGAHKEGEALAREMWEASGRSWP